MIEDPLDIQIACYTGLNFILLSDRDITVPWALTLHLVPRSHCLTNRKPTLNWAITDKILANLVYCWLDIGHVCATGVFLKKNKMCCACEKPKRFACDVACSFCLPHHVYYIPLCKMRHEVVLSSALITFC